MSFDESDLRRRMNGALNSLKEEFIGLRTGRASTALLAVSYTHLTLPTKA